jgi:hypothetical protein
MRKVLICLLGLLFIISIGFSTAVNYSSVSIAPSNAASIVIEQTKYDPFPAAPGEYVKIWIKVENWGGKEMTNAVFQLVPHYPFYLDPGDEGIHVKGRIGSFQQVLLEYKLRVDSAALEKTYDDELFFRVCSDINCAGWIKEIPIEISVNPGGEPKVELGIQDSDIFYGGKKGSVTLNVVNRGTLDIKFLVVELQPSESYEMLSPNRIYVGELESDDYDTVDFDIYVSNNVGKTKTETLPLTVLLDYSDINDKEYMEKISTSIKVYSVADMKKMQLISSSNTGLYIAIVVILIIVYFGYRKFKKKG